MLTALLLTTLTTVPAQYAWTHDAHGGQCVARGPRGSVIVWHDGRLTQTTRPTGAGEAHARPNSIRYELGHPPSGVDTWRVADCPPTTISGVVVALPDRHEVQIHTTTVEPKRIGGHGNRLTQFNGPCDVATNGHRIAVADRGNRRVLLLDMQGANIGMYDTIDGAELELPCAVAMSHDGTLFIADEATHKVHALEADGTHRWTIGGWGKAPGRFAEPTGIDVQDGVLLVADRLNHRIQAIDSSTGAPIDWWGMHAIKPREGEGRIHYPEDVAFTENGCVVAEPFERRVQAFTDGDADKAKAPTGPQSPKSHFGPRMGVHGRALVLWEPEMRAMHVLDLSRPVPIHTTTFGEQGDAAGCLEHPIAFKLEDTDNGLELRITDAADGRTHTWRLDLPPLDRPGFDADMAKLLSSTPKSASATTWAPFNRDATLPDGRRIALETDSKVHVYDREGVELFNFGGHGSEHGTFWNPTELAVDDWDRILVLDHGNHRLQGFDLEGHWLMSFGTGRSYTPKNAQRMRKATP